MAAEIRLTLTETVDDRKVWSCLILQTAEGRFTPLRYQIGDASWADFYNDGSFHTRGEALAAAVDEINRVMAIE